MCLKIFNTFYFNFHRFGHLHKEIYKSMTEASFVFHHNIDPHVNVWSLLRRGFRDQTMNVKSNKNAPESVFLVKKYKLKNYIFFLYSF